MMRQVLTFAHRAGPVTFARPSLSLVSPLIPRFFRITTVQQAPKLTKEQLEAQEEVREMGLLIEEREAAALEFKKGSRRTGLIGEKLGMMNLFDHWGKHITVTVVRVDNHVIHHNEAPCPKTGLSTMKIGSGKRKPKATPDWLARMCERSGVDFKKRLHDFPVTEDSVIPVGTRLHARHFLPGQDIDVTAITVGRGFQGPMKRWGFKGQNASHGVSVTHRSHGSTGSTGVGKVFKGKKMAGNMGNQIRTQLNCKIYRIDTDRNLLFLMGSTPGNEGCTMLLHDARVKKWKKEEQVPAFPTYFPSDNEPKSLVMEPQGDRKSVV